MIKEKIKEKKFLGYIDSAVEEKDFPKPFYAGGSVLGAGSFYIMQGMRIDALKENYFGVSKDKAPSLQTIEDNLKDCEVVRFAEHSGGKMFTQAKWVKDDKNDLIISMPTGYLIGDEGYLKGFGHPLIYDIENGTKVLDLKEKLDKLDGKGRVGAGIGLVCMISALLDVKYGMGGFMLSSAYAWKKKFWDGSKVEDEIRPIRPLNGSYDFFKRIGSKDASISRLMTTRSNEKRRKIKGNME